MQRSPDIKEGQGSTNRWPKE